MAIWIDDLGIGEGLEIGVEAVGATGQHGHLDTMPAQFERLYDPGRSGANHQHRRATEKIGRDFLTDHRVSMGSFIALMPV
jgi:hypothetical protein